MAFTTTRAERADRSRLMQAFLAATVTTIGIASLSLSAVAQVKAPTKSQLKAAPHKPAANPANAPSPTDNQADQLNAQWLKEHSDGALTPVPAATADNAAPSATVPVSATMPGAGARVLVNGSVKLVSAKAAAGFLPGGPNQGALQPLSDAFAGFAAAKPRLEMFEGRTADGATHLLYASLGEGKAKRSYWWFMPLDQPEGWFDENGKRRAAQPLGQPKPGARISSPFGTRH